MPGREEWMKQMKLEGKYFQNRMIMGYTENGNWIKLIGITIPGKDEWTLDDPYFIAVSQSAYKWRGWEKSIKS